MPEQPPSRPIALICPHCQHPVIANPRGRAVWSGYQPDSHIPDGPPEIYEFLQCNRCDQPMIQSWQDFNDGNDEDRYFLFPAARRLSTDVPVSLREGWEEARRCLNAKAHVACVVMVRRLVDLLAAENGIKSRGPADSVTKLRDAGVIDDTLVEWMTALRSLGNAGAHRGDSMSRQDAEDALGFGEALLDHIYVMRRRFEEFKARVASR